MAALLPGQFYMKSIVNILVLRRFRFKIDIQLLKARFDFRFANCHFRFDSLSLVDAEVAVAPSQGKRRNYLRMHGSCVLNLRTLRVDSLGLSTWLGCLWHSPVRPSQTRKRLRVRTRLCFHSDVLNDVWHRIIKNTWMTAWYLCSHIILLWFGDYFLKIGAWPR